LSHYSIHRTKLTRRRWFQCFRMILLSQLLNLHTPLLSTMSNTLGCAVARTVTGAQVGVQTTMRPTPAWLSPQPRPELRHSCLRLYPRPRLLIHPPQLLLMHLPPHLLVHLPRRQLLCLLHCQLTCPLRHQLLYQLSVLRPHPPHSPLHSRPSYPHLRLPTTRATTARTAAIVRWTAEFATSPAAARTTGHADVSRATGAQPAASTHIQATCARG
jgi:hypothetical protein